VVCCVLLAEAPPPPKVDFDRFGPPPSLPLSLRGMPHHSQSRHISSHPLHPPHTLPPRKAAPAAVERDLHRAKTVAAAARHGAGGAGRAGLQLGIERLFAQQIRVFDGAALAAPTLDAVVGTVLKVPQWLLLIHLSVPHACTFTLFPIPSLSLHPSHP
jgi:hypothetical protein